MSLDLEILPDGLALAALTPFFAMPEEEGDEDDYEDEDEDEDDDYEDEDEDEDDEDGEDDEEYADEDED